MIDEQQAPAAAASSAELVARIRAGEAAAESELVARFARPLRLLLERQTNRRPEAADLFQEVCRLVLTKLRAGELRDAEKLPGFVAQIGRSLAIEHYRKAARRKTEPDSDALGAAVDPAASPLAELLASERASLVRRLIAELGTSRDRELLLRFYVAEEDREQIAADFGLTSLQLNRVLHRARQRLRALAEERAPSLLAVGGWLAPAILGRLVTLFSWVLILGPGTAALAGGGRGGTWGQG